MSSLIPYEPEEEENEAPSGSYIEFLKHGNTRGCSCSAGCLQIIIVLVLLGIAIYMLFFRS